MSIPDTALSVAGVTAYIHDLLEDDRQLQQVWVTGEVSSLQEHRSGLFLSLCEPDGSAMIKCVVWRSQCLQLAHQPKLGEQILILGSIRVYSKRGEYQLNVFQVLATGEGLQALRYQQLRSRLEAEGVFDSGRKRSLPIHPQVVAVVTSSSAAAWGDIQRTLKQRYPGLHVLLSPATVQGTQAPISIAEAIERVDRDGRAEVILLARGGGSGEDLSCFNDEGVVRAIAESTIPVVTGIGHQRDESLADLVADVSVHTPTAAAELVVPHWDQLVAEHQHRVGTLTQVMQQQLARETERLEQLHSDLKAFPSTSRRLQQAIARTDTLQQKLNALDPKRVLKRGYAVVRQKDNALVRSTANLVPDQELIIHLGQGLVKAKITAIEPKDE